MGKSKRKFIYVNDVSEMTDYLSYCGDMAIPCVIIYKSDNREYSKVEVNIMLYRLDIQNYVREDLKDSKAISCISETLKISDTLMKSELGEQIYSINIINKYAEVMAEALFDMYFKSIQKAVKYIKVNNIREVL